MGEGVLQLVWQIKKRFVCKSSSKGLVDSGFVPAGGGKAQHPAQKA